MLVLKIIYSSMSYMGLVTDSCTEPGFYFLFFFFLFLLQLVRCFTVLKCKFSPSVSKSSFLHLRYESRIWLLMYLKSHHFGTSTVTPWVSATIITHWDYSNDLHWSCSSRFHLAPQSLCFPPQSDCGVQMEVRSCFHQDSGGFPSYPERGTSEPHGTWAFPL